MKNRKGRRKRVNMQRFEEEFKKQRKLRNEVVDFLKDKGLTYTQALSALKDAQSYLERASLKNRL